MKHKLAIFDFDGTIVDSQELYVETIHTSLLKSFFLYPKGRIAKALGPKLDMTLKNLNIAHKTRKKLSKSINEQIMEKASSIRLCPYAKQILQMLKARKCKVALVTNSVKKFVLLYLNKNKLTKYFDVILGGDNFKDKESAFRMLFRKFKVKPKEVIYVADKISDFKIARKVGCSLVLVKACSWDKNKLKLKSYSRYVIKDLRDLKKL